MKLLSIIFFCVIITLSSTKKLESMCPEKEVIENFDVERYLGKWYIINRYDDSQTIRTPKCVVAEYLRNTEGKLKTILKFVDDSNKKQTSESQFILNPNGSGNLSTLKKPDGTVVPNYNILETDYENFAIVWKCRNTGDNQSEEATWVLSRNLIVSNDVRKIIDAAIDRRLERKFLLTVNHDKKVCGY